MLIEKIEDNLKKLIINFEKDTFIYDLLTAYEQPKTSVNRLKKGDIKIGQPNVFLGCSVKSPLLLAIPSKVQPKTSSLGSTVKSIVYSLNPNEIVAIIIKINIMFFFEM